MSASSFLLGSQFPQSYPKASIMNLIEQGRLGNQKAILEAGRQLHIYKTLKHDSRPHSTGRFDERMEAEIIRLLDHLVEKDDDIQASFFRVGIMHENVERKLETPKFLKEVELKHIALAIKYCLQPCMEPIFQDRDEESSPESIDSSTSSSGSSAGSLASSSGLSTDSSGSSTDLSGSSADATANSSGLSVGLAVMSSASGSSASSAVGSLGSSAGSSVSSLGSSAVSAASSSGFFSAASASSRSPAGSAANSSGFSAASMATSSSSLAGSSADSSGLSMSSSARPYELYAASMAKAYESSVGVSRQLTSQSSGLLPARYSVNKCARPCYRQPLRVVDQSGYEADNEDNLKPKLTLVRSSVSS